VEEPVGFTGTRIDIPVLTTEYKGVSLQDTHGPVLQAHCGSDPVQRQSRPVRRLPQAAQRAGVRKVTIPLAAPARTMSHAAAAVAIAAKL
jgi:hypothetical protein